MFYSNYLQIICQLIIWIIEICFQVKSLAKVSQNCGSESRKTIGNREQALDRVVQRLQPFQMWFMLDLAVLADLSMTERATRLSLHRTITTDNQCRQCWQCHHRWPLPKHSTLTKHTLSLRFGEWVIQEISDHFMPLVIRVAKSQAKNNSGNMLNLIPSSKEL